MKDRYFLVARSALEWTVGKGPERKLCTKFCTLFRFTRLQVYSHCTAFHFAFWLCLCSPSPDVNKIAKNPQKSGCVGPWWISMPQVSGICFSTTKCGNSLIFFGTAAALPAPSPHPPSPQWSISQAHLGPPGAIWGMSAYVMTRETYAQSGSAGVVATAAAIKCWKKSQKIAINHENIQGGLGWLWGCPGVFWEAATYVLETVWHVLICLKVNAVLKLPVSAVAKGIWEFQGFRHMPVRTLALTYLKWAWTFQKRQLHQSGSTSWEPPGSGFRTCPGTLDLLECSKNTSLNRKNTPKIFMEGPDLPQLTWFNLILEARRWGSLLKVQTWAASFKTAEA